MATQSNWNLKYIAGNPKTRSHVSSDMDNPQRRSQALDGANKIAKNNWRVWVEHDVTKERIFESDAEKEHLASLSKA